MAFLDPVAKLRHPIDRWAVWEKLKAARFAGDLEDVHTAIVVDAEGATLCAEGRVGYGGCGDEGDAGGEEEDEEVEQTHPGLESCW